MTQDRVRFEQALNRGHSYSWDQRWQEAIEEFTAAVQILPDEPAPYAGLGMAYLELNTLSKALDNYKLAARFSRGNIIYLRKVADVQERMELLSEAGQTYMAIGEMELSKRRLNEAMDNWHRAVRLAPTLLRAHQRLASVYQRQGATRNAVQEYLTIAQILQGLNEKEKALEACQQALQLDPRNKDILTAAEMIRQGEKIFDSDSPYSTPLSSSSSLAGLVPSAVAEGDPDWQAVEQASQTVALVRDARRKAMELLAAQLFSDSDDDESDAGQFERDHLISQALDSQRRELTAEAISQYEKAMSRGENSAAAHFNLGLLYQDNLQFENAIRQFKLVQQDETYHLACHFSLGESYRALGRIGDAVSHFIYVLKKIDLATVPPEKSANLSKLYDNLEESLSSPDEQEQATDFANALVELLSNKNWQEKVNEARKRVDIISDAGMMILGDVLTAGSARVLESLYLSQEYTRKKMYNTAIEETYHAIQLSPEYLPSHIQLAEVLAKQGRREVAALKFATIADTYRVRNDVNSAAAAYERVVELLPLDLSTRMRLIELLKQNGQTERSLEHQIALGEAYYQLAQADKARESYQAALKLTPAASDEKSWKVRILRLIADIDMQRFDWRQALAAYKELRELDPENEATATTLVGLYYRVGQAANAVRALDVFLNQLVRSRRSKEVISILEQMVAKQPADANLVDRLSRLYLQQKRHQEAIDLLDKLGEAQLETGNTEGAIKTIGKIVSLNPANVANYQQLISQLRQQLP